MTSSRDARTKGLFWIGIAGLIVYEAVNVYFIMPMPGSQRMRSLDLAYAIHTWRWPVRLALGALALAGAASWWRPGGRRRWVGVVAVAAVAVVAYAANFRMAADQTFKQPRTLSMLPTARNRVAGDRLVVGVEVNGEARAYPLQYIGYHHQVRDSVGGVPVMVSYCTVCRTGRVYSPIVDRRPERFRLVGMDHFNAMFEDETTGSWWRQANGEAVTGERKGATLQEIPSLQVTLTEWLALHPRSLVMQADPAFAGEYAKDYAFENGSSRKTLTGTDTTSWGEKSWVIGIEYNEQSKAFDWNVLRQARVINDDVGGLPVVIALAPDNASFYAYERPSPDLVFTVQGDSLMAGGQVWPVSGRALGGLRRLKASQEFWHSWREFHPGTTR